MREPLKLQKKDVYKRPSACWKIKLLIAAKKRREKSQNVIEGHWTRIE